MYKEKYYSSKTPLPLVLLFLLNIFLVVAFQLLFVFKYPTNMDEAALGKVNPQWADCTILSQDSYSTSLEAYLIELPDGSRQLITLKPHGIIFGRSKLAGTQILEPQEAEQIFYVKTGVHTAEISVIGGDTVDIRYGYGGSMTEALALPIVLSAALEGLELLVYYLIKKNL